MFAVTVVNICIYLSFTFYILKYFYDSLTPCVLYACVLRVTKCINQYSIHSKIFLRFYCRAEPRGAQRGSVLIQNDFNLFHCIILGN